MDCMKMWPWMRDLPTSVWAGRGWAFDQNGLRRLSSTGGSGAMQGVEVFESVGAAAEELKPIGAIVREAASAAPHAALPVTSREVPKPTKFMRNNLVKQSGVPGVLWNSTCFAWEVQIPKYDSKGKRKGKTNRVFSVKKFKINGRNEAEADAGALKAAKAFHAELVHKGIIKEPKEQDPNFTSDVPGVLWSKKSKKWRVQISLKRSNPNETRKKVSGGHFMEKAAAEAEALRLQELHGVKREVKAVSTLSALPVFEPKVPYRGVNWNQAEQQWRATCRVGGLQRDVRIKPKDHSEAELERSFQVAVAWRKRQEKEREKMAKSKPKPQKKRCRWVQQPQVLSCKYICIYIYKAVKNPPSACLNSTSVSKGKTKLRQNCSKKRQVASSHPNQQMWVLQFWSQLWSWSWFPPTQQNLERHQDSRFAGGSKLWSRSQLMIANSNVSKWGNLNL